ncbi:MAG: hypothetical protein APF81_09065 [Desulfosporosinus sp. BRH_c37]|nr:MAG: hypothetical protein APF81_09065 [Desulfosporosinus sp. BRH_c37]
MDHYNIERELPYQKNKLIANGYQKDGIKRKIHPHIIRHTFATRMLRNGASLKNVSDELGHENLVTTKIFTDTELEKKRMIYWQCMG